MSSLVFVVIVAVWAVYLVQHWVRRRDHLATARSVDRFSEAMRVLERRRALPAPETEGRPRSYAASPLRPARPGRPEVVVKSGLHGATAVAPSEAHRRARVAARVRGAGLLAGSLTMVALVALSVAGLLPRWWAVVGIAAAGLSLGLVRWSVTRRHSRPAARPVARPAASARPASAPSRAAAPARAAAPRRAARPLPVAHRESEPEARVGHEFAAQSVAATLRTAPRREAARAPELYDVVEVEAALEPVKPVPTAEELAELDAPVVQPTDGTWSPVPVPPPTYTLKAKAHRGRQVSASLPADGTEMALDEEFEELPRIDLVG